MKSIQYAILSKGTLDKTSISSQQKLLLHIDMNFFGHHMLGTHIINPHRSNAKRVLTLYIMYVTDDWHG